MSKKAISIDIGSLGTTVMEVNKDFIDIVYNQEGGRKYTTSFSFNEDQIFFGQLGQTYPTTFYGIKDALLESKNLEDLHSKKITIENKTFYFYEIVALVIKTAVSKAKQAFDTIVFVKNHNFKSFHDIFLVECTRIAGFTQSVNFIYDNISAICDFLYRKISPLGTYKIAHVIVGENCSVSTFAEVCSNEHAYKVQIIKEKTNDSLTGESLTYLIYKQIYKKSKIINDLWKMQNHELINAVRKAKEELTPSGVKQSKFKFLPPNNQNEIVINCDLKEYQDDIYRIYKNTIHRIFRLPKDFQPNYAQVLGGAGRTPMLQKIASLYYGNSVVQSLNNEECFAEGALAPMLVSIKIDHKDPYTTVEVHQTHWLEKATKSFESLIRICNHSIEVDRVSNIVEKVAHDIKRAPGVSEDKKVKLRELSEEAESLGSEITKNMQVVKDHLGFLFAAGELVKHDVDKYKEIAAIVEDPTEPRGKLSLEKPGPTKVSALRKAFAKNNKNDLAKDLRDIYNTYYLSTK